MDEIKKLQDELDFYKKALGSGDVATRGYIAIVKLLEQQITFLDSFDLKSNITNATKDNPVYERSQKIFKEMPEVIMALKDLKDKLGIEYIEKEERIIATTPQSIGLKKLINV